MAASYSEVSKYAKERFDLVYGRCHELEKSLREAQFQAQARAVTTIEPYEPRLTNISDFVEEECCALFMDTRRSTADLARYGARVSYVWAHTFLATMAYVVQKTATGTVVDYTGDGVYVLFCPDENHGRDFIIKEAGAIGCRMMKSALHIVNPMITACGDISRTGVVNRFSYGIGVDMGTVVVTKMGTDRFGGIVAIGNCINSASHTSNGIDKVVISQAMKDNYPREEGGTIRIETDKNGTHHILWEKLDWS